MILLDTHAWLWWVSAPERLTSAARGAIDRADVVGVCAASAFELAYLVQRGRVALDRGVDRWVTDSLALERVEGVPVGTEVAVRAGLLELERFPGDPLDRLIYAAAIECRARLVTADRRIGAYDPARTIW